MRAGVEMEVATKAWASTFNKQSRVSASVVLLQPRSLAALLPLL